MGPWLLRTSAVLLLAVAAASAWHFGTQFTRDWNLERSAIAAMAVPPTDLSALVGQNRATADSLPVKLVNTTAWHLTAVTLALETSDKKPLLRTEVTERFRPDPWAPGGTQTRDVSLAAEWNGRPVRYRVTAAKGFRSSAEVTRN